MKQAATVELFAGGPGSGCRGNKCGRPKGAGPEQEGEVFHGPKGQPAPQVYRPQVGEPYNRLAREAETARRKMSAEDQQLYQKKLAELRQAGRLGHQPSEQEKTNVRILEPSDKVVLLQKQDGWTKGPRGNPKELPVGYTARVDDVFDRNGMAPAMAKISFSKKSNLESFILPIDEIQLLEKGKANVAPIDPQPVRKSKVVSRSTTADGAQYTVVRPSMSGMVEEDMRGKLKPHGLKGKFKDVTGQVKVLNEPMTRSQVFFAQYGKAPEYEPASDKFGTYVVRNPEAYQGTSVFVYRHYDTNTTVIREINAGQYGHVFTQSRQWTYKNHGSASGFLKKRYGISQSLPKNLPRRQK